METLDEAPTQAGFSTAATFEDQALGMSDYSADKGVCDYAPMEGMRKNSFIAGCISIQDLDQPSYETAAGSSSPSYGNDDRGHFNFTENSSIPANPFCSCEFEADELLKDDWLKPSVAQEKSFPRHVHGINSCTEGGFREDVPTLFQPQQFFSEPCSLASSHSIDAASTVSSVRANQVYGSMGSCVVEPSWYIQGAPLSSAGASSHKIQRPLFVRARETGSEGVPAGSPNDGIVISSCRKEWSEKLQLLKRDFMAGNIKAVGNMSDSEQGTARRVVVVEPYPSQLPACHPLLKVHLADYLHKESSKPAHTMALGKPVFSPFEQGMLALGEELHPLREGSPALMIFSVRRSPLMRIKCLASATLPNHPSGLCWLSSNELLIAAGSRLLIMKTGESALKTRSELPRFHTDDIRDIQLNPYKAGCCISGGYDGKVFITDLERVVSDQLGSMRQSQNLVYNAVDPVSCVQWNTAASNVVSATCDSGILHVLDPRVGSSDRRTVVVDTGSGQLNTHAWIHSSALLLGYGDGTLRLFDMRKPDSCVLRFCDPNVNLISDLVLDPQRRYAVTLGSPRFSVWRFDTQGFTLLLHDPECVSTAQLDQDKAYKVSGSFLLTGGRQHGILGTTDTLGNLALYDLNSAECPAVLIPTSS